MQDIVEYIVAGKDAVKDPSGVGESAIQKELCNAVPEPAGAVTPELQAVAAGCIMPSATGTVIPDSDGQDTSKQYTQPTLLLPDMSARSTKKGSSQGELGELASGDEDIVQDSENADETSPVDRLLAAGASPVDSAQPADGTSPSLPGAGAEAEADTGGARESNQRTAVVDTLEAVQTDPVAATNAVDGTHSLRDAAAGGASGEAASDAGEEPSEAPEATGADKDVMHVRGASEKVKEEPALVEGGMPMHEEPMHDETTGDAAHAVDVEEVVHDSQEGVRRGVSPGADGLEAAAAVPSSGVTPTEDAEAVEAGAEDFLQEASPVDVVCGEAAEVNAEMADVDADGAAGSSNPHDSPASLPDTQMLMMTQPADTVDLAVCFNSCCTSCSCIKLMHVSQDTLSFYMKCAVARMLYEHPAKLTCL